MSSAEPLERRPEGVERFERRDRDLDVMIGLAASPGTAVEPM
jgi:hypothetical protein